MSREAAIQMVDDRESDARRRFEQLKSEMSGRATAMAHKNGRSGLVRGAPARYRGGPRKSFLTISTPA